MDRSIYKEPTTFRHDPEDQRSVLAVFQDDELTAEVVALLESHSIRVVPCGTGLPGSEFLRLLSPGLALVEFEAVSGDVSPVVRVFKEADETVPLIVLADPADRVSAGRALADGAYEVAARPVVPELLLNAVRRGLEYANLLRFKRDAKRVMEEEIAERTIEIARTNDFLAGILDSSTLVSVILTDLDQNVLFWNSGARNIFGYTPDEMKGEKITKLYPPDSMTRETVEKLRKMVATKTGTVHGKMQQVSKDGRILTISLALSPMLDARGEVSGILGVGLDVTEEVRQHKEILNLLEQVKKTQDVTIFSLAKLAESRDHETGQHLNRIQAYSKVLCERMARKEGMKDAVTQRFIDDLVRSCVLHDIGKVAISDEILLSREKFGARERKIMEEHTIAGGEALKEAVEKLGKESFLTLGMEVAYFHHEHWDGNGYPQGLKGEAIPLSARIVAIADVYDALTTERRYKKAFSHEEAGRLIVERRGSQFDPEIVDVFLEVEAEFQRIRGTVSPC